MSAEPAVLSEPPARDAEPFVPPGAYRGRLEDFGYVEEEWFATGEEGGRPYATRVLVRRPGDPNRFSGTVVAEPLHALGATPIWLYTSAHLMRSGHGWAEIASQKSALDTHVRPYDEQRYARLHIEADPGPAEATQRPAGSALPLGDPARMAAYMAEMRRLNRASSAILAQVGAALRGPGGPFAACEIGHVILAGHSQTGGVVTDYIRQAHGTARRAGGSPVYDGYFPTGAPREPFAACEVPILQVLSEGDIADPHRAGREGRAYRRPDGDEAGDRFRLYELAGVAHMGTRHAPYDDPRMWQQAPTAGRVALDQVMNSLPHNELFSMALHHLVRWVAAGVTPPRAERIAVATDGWLAADAHGNCLGGVRCAQLDVPRATYLANPRNPDGTPGFGVVGSERPLPAGELRRLYRDHRDYVERFGRRLDELIDEGWFLHEDAAAERALAEAAPVP
jgi:hypothetical protein